MPPRSEPHTRRSVKKWLFLSYLLRPAKVAHRPAGIPDFGHVTDFVAIKLHDVDVIGAGALPCWRAGTALTGMRCREYAVSAHAAALMICGKRFYDIPPVWHEGQQTLHPFGVGLQRADFGQRF